MGRTIDPRIGLRDSTSISAVNIQLPQSLQSCSDFSRVEQISFAKVKLVSQGRRGDVQCAIGCGALDSDGPDPELIALRNGSDDEDALLPISGGSKRLRRRVMNHNLKISSFLEVGPDALRCFIGQFFAIVIFSTLPGLQDSLSYSILVMNPTFDFKVA